MTLDEIKQALTACLSGGVFTGPDTLFGSATLKAAFDQGLPGGALVINGAAIAETATSVVVSGAGQGPFAGLTVTAAFTPQGDDVGLVAEGTGGGWSFAGAFPALAQSILADLESPSNATVVLRTLTDGTHPPGLSFNGPIGVAGPAAQMAKFVGVDPTLAFAGPIGFSFGAPNFTLKAPVSVPLNLGPLNNLGLTATLTSIAAPPIDPSAGPGYGANGAIALVTAVPVTVNGASANLPASVTFDGGPIVSLAIDAPTNAGVAISDMLEFALGGALDDLMPPASLYDVTGALALNAITFTVAPLTPAMLGVNFALAAQKDWTIGSQFAVTGVTLNLDVSTSNGVSLAGAINGVLQIGPNGSICSLDASAALPKGTFTAKLAATSPKPNISDLITYVAGDFGLPAILVSNLDLFLDPTDGQYSLSAGFSTDWSLSVGDFGLAVTDVSIEIAKGAGGVTGEVSGSLILDQNNSFDLSYAVPGGFSLYAQVPSLSLSDLIAALCKAVGATPPGFSFTFENATILITKDTGQFEFSFGAQLDAYGSAAVVVKNGGAGWGYAFGIALDTTTLGSLPGLGLLDSFDKAFGLDEIVVVLGSLADSSFTFPALSQFQNPSIKSASINSPGWSGGLMPGLNVYAMLDPAASQAFGWLCKLVGFSGKMATSLQVPSDASQPVILAATLAGSVNSNMSMNGQFVAKLIGGNLDLGLVGRIPTTISQHAVVFSIEIDFQANGVFISGSTPDTISFDDVVQLGGLAIELGVDDEGIPSIGVAATIQVGDFDSSIAIFFDSSVPTQSLFSGAISDVTLDTILGPIAGLAPNAIPGEVRELMRQFSLKGVRTFTIPGSVADALNARNAAPVIAAFSQAGEPINADPRTISILGSTQNGAWAVTDLSTLTHYHLTTSAGAITVEKEVQVACVPQTTQIGNLPPVSTRFALSGQLSVFSFTGMVDVNIVASQGLYIEAALTPLVLGNGALLSITDANDTTKGPHLSVSSYTQNGQPPHAQASARANLLGLVQTLDVNISASGATFQLASTVPVYQYSIDVTLNAQQGFRADGSAQVGFDQTIDLGLLGQLPVDVTVGGTVKVGFDGHQAEAGFSGSFTFQGVPFNTGVVQLDVTAASLANLADNLVDAVIQAIKTYLLGNLDPSVWLGWVKNNIIPGIDQDAKAVGQALGSAFKQSADQIASETHTVLGYGADAAATALQAANFTADVAAQALAGAGYAANDIANAIKDTFSNIHADTGVHIDIGGGPHADGTPHLDTPGGPHGDSAVPPHGDGNPHVDTPQGPHIDTHGDVWGVGTHADSALPPHGDTHLHTDTPSGPHVDGAVPPHADTQGPHGDTQVPPHIDTPGTHIDVRT